MKPKVTPVVVLLLTGFIAIYLYSSQSTIGETQDKPFKEFVELAEQGDANVQSQLAGMYFFGDGVPKDDIKGLLMYRDAAKQGDVRAQYMLGVIFSMDDVQNYKEALKWHAKAAEQNFASAQFQIGRMYSRGKGVLEDDEKTICWFKKAADQGHRDAQYHMGELYIKGQRVERDLKRAKYWIEKSLESTDENIIRKSKHLWEKHNLERY